MVLIIIGANGSMKSKKTIKVQCRLIFQLLVFVLAAFLLVSCAEKEAARTGEGRKSGSKIAGWTLNDSIDAAPCIFTGKCLSVKEGINSTFEMRLCVSKALRGNTEGEVEVIGGERFEVGREYLILSRRAASVYTGKPLYYFADAALYEDENGACRGFGGELTEYGFGQIIDAVSARVGEKPYEGEDVIIGEYCVSADLRAVCDYSDFIAVVEVKDIDAEFADRVNCICTVRSVLKGEAPYEIKVAFFKGGVEKGGRYLILACEKNGGGIYHMSSPYSLLDLNGEDARRVSEMLGR